MPIYEYKCLDCESRFEKMQKVSDEPLKICEKCGGALEKQWSLSGFQFKGAGWYVTDYANKTKESGAGKTASTESGEKNEKSEKSENTEKGEKTEKSSTTESTVNTESASKQSSENATVSKTESATKKD